MLKRILVPLDASDNMPVATEFSAEMAIGRKIHTPARLFGLSLVDTDVLPTGRFASLVPREKILAEAKVHSAELVEKFLALTQKLKMPPELVETGSAIGSPFREIIRQGVFSDLIVMGRQASFPPLAHDYDALAHLIHQASRPVFIVGDHHEKVNHVVIAMDGTAPASRMMYAYAHLNPFPTAMVHVVCSQKEMQEFNLEEFFSKVPDFLKSYGIESSLKEVPGDLDEELPGVVRQTKSQVVAIGVHAEHILEKFRESLRIGQYPIQKLVRDTGAALFTVH